MATSGYFHNKVVWVTGASSGIGEACVHEFARQGATLVLSSRRQAELERVAQEAQLPEERVMVLPLDLAQYDQMERLAQQVIDRFGCIDVLLNNGGISQRSLIVKTDMSVYERLIQVDYLGTIAITKAVLPHFIKQQSGQYATVTSLMGVFSSQYRSGYCGAKHALHGFFNGLRLEHDVDGIDVTMICPGFINTNVSVNALSADGSALNQMDKATAEGLSAKECARQIVEAIKRKKWEVYIGGKETLVAYLKRISPKLVHKVLKRMAVR